jgi:hypothetical protein
MGRVEWTRGQTRATPGGDGVMQRMRISTRDSRATCEAVGPTPPLHEEGVVQSFRPGVDQPLALACTFGSPFTGTCFGWTSAFFGTVMVSTPSLSSADACSGSVPKGSVNERVNEP